MKKIKLFEPSLDKKEEKAVVKTLRSKFWASGSGTGEVAKFEKQLGKYVGSNYCVAVNSGTAALHLAFSLFCIKGKEVILPSISFVSTAHAVIFNGGIPIFAEVDPDTLCLDPNDVEKKITKKTRLILPVHFGGIPCNLEKLGKICRQNNLQIIEDAAHAIGTRYKNKKIGSYGDAVCFSFHPVKNLAMPTGGAITLNKKNSSKLRINLLARRWCGITNRKGPKYDVKELGWNFYMNEISATIGLIQLNKLEEMIKKRKGIAKRYSEEINEPLKMPYNGDSSYHLYWIRVKNRDAFMKNMSLNKVETGIHYLPIHKMSFYKRKQKLPISDNIGKEIVSIPMHANLSNAKVSKIIRLVNKFC